MVVAHSDKQDYRICICRANRYIVRGSDERIIIGALPNNVIAGSMLISFCEASNYKYCEELDSFDRSYGTCEGCAYNLGGRCYHEIIREQK